MMRIPNLTIYHSTNASLTSVKRLVFNGYALVSLYAQLKIFQFKITRSAKWFRENSLNMVLFQSRLKDKYIVFCLSVAHLFICLFLVSPFCCFRRCCFSFVLSLIKFSVLIISVIIAIPGMVEL